MSRAIDQLIVELSASGHGIVTRCQLTSAGIAPASISRRVGELLTVVIPGVYAVGPITGNGWLAVALAAEPNAAAAGLTAGKLHGLPVREHERSFVAVPEATRRRFPDPISSRRTRHLPSEDVTIVDGLRVTTVERTVCDLATSVSIRQRSYSAVTARVARARWPTMARNDGSSGR